MLLSSIGVILAWTALKIADRVDDMSKSVIELNSTMKVVVKQIDRNNVKLQDHEKRLYIMEFNKKVRD